jgi:hypothetical protein
LARLLAVLPSGAERWLSAKRQRGSVRRRLGRWWRGRSSNDSTGLVRGAPVRCERGGRPYRMFTPDGPAPHSDVEGAGCSRHKSQRSPHHRDPAAPRSQRDTRVFQRGRGSNATRRQPAAQVRNGHLGAEIGSTTSALRLFRPRLKPPSVRLRELDDVGVGSRLRNWRDRRAIGGF